MDMIMLDISEEKQISMVKGCSHIVPVWKFYQKDFHSNFCEDEKTMCWLISDEAFILLCLINYGKRWFVELVKAEKMVGTKWFVKDK
jgi:hypothetical protein